MADILTPGSEEELADVIRSGKGPFRIEGGGTRSFGLTDAEAVLSTKGLSGITLYEPGALTLVAKAGTPLAEIEQALAAENQILAFEPMDHRSLLGTSGEPTIGGVMAANVSGPRRVQAGACRDFALGVRFVDGSGNIVKNGGRVMKNVTGYDLVKLMAGAHGTLGVLSEVSFKVLPKPDTASVLLFEGLGVEDGIAAMSAALASPFDVSGAAHVPVGLDGDPVTMIRVEGFEASVSYRAQRLKDALSRFGSAKVESRPGDDGGRGTGAGWKWVSDAKMFEGGDRDIWRVSVKPSDAALLAGRFPGADLLFDWGGGLVWIGVTPDSDVRSVMAGIPGHATLVRAETATKRRLGVFQPEAPALSALAQGLRARFDPKGLLNPGLMDAPKMETA